MKGEGQEGDEKVHESGRLREGMRRFVKKEGQEVDEKVCEKGRLGSE
jgi:hypothetical protein